MLDFHFSRGDISEDNVLVQIRDAIRMVVPNWKERVIDKDSDFEFQVMAISNCITRGETEKALRLIDRLDPNETIVGDPYYLEVLLQICADLNKSDIIKGFLKQYILNNDNWKGVNPKKKHLVNAYLINLYSKFFGQKDGLRMLYEMFRG